MLSSKAIREKQREMGSRVESFYKAVASNLDSYKSHPDLRRVLSWGTETFLRKKPITYLDVVEALFRAGHKEIIPVVNQLNFVSARIVNLEAQNPFFESSELKKMKEIFNALLYTAKVASFEFIYFSRWRACKSVYVFDEILVEELAETQLDLVPIDALLRIPDPAPLIMLPKPIPATVYLSYSKGVSAKRVLVHGFGVTYGLPPDHDPPHQVLFTFSFFVSEIGSGEGESPANQANLEAPTHIMNIALPLPSGTHLVKAIKNLILQEVRHYFSSPHKEGLHDEIVRSYHKLLSLAFNLTLYLTQEEPDLGNVQPPKPKALGEREKFTPAHIPSQPVVVPVGWRWGEAVRRYRKVIETVRGNEEEYLPSGKRVSPHIRRAHWHLYWTGKGIRKDPSKAVPVVKWVPATVVNLDLLVESGMNLDDLPGVARYVTGE